MIPLLLLALLQVSDPPAILGRQRQEGRIESLSWSPDGRTILTGSDHGILRFWDAGTGRERRRWGGEEVTTSAAFSPDGLRVALSSGGGEGITLRSVADGREVRRWGPFFGMIREVAFSPDGKLLAAGGADGKIHLWEIESGKEVFTFEEEVQTVFTVAFSADGKRLALGGAHGTVRFWDMPPRGEGTKLRPRGAGSTSSVRFSPDGRTLLAGGGRSGLVAWDLSTAAARPLAPIGIDVGSLAVSPSGKAVAYVADSDRVRVVDAGTGKLVFEREAERGATAVAYAPDGKTLAVGDGRGNLWLLDPATGKDRLAPQGHREAVRRLTPTPDGRLLLSEDDRDVRIWDLATGLERLCVRASRENGWKVGHLTADASTLYASTEDRKFLCFDVATGAEKPSVPLLSYAAALAPDGVRLAAAGGDRFLRLWDLHRVAELWKTETRDHPIVTLAVSPDGRTVAGGTANVEIVRLYDARTGEMRREIRDPKGFDWVQSLTYAPDGRVLAWNTGGARIRLADPASGRILKSFEIGGAEKVESPGFAFSSDGRLLVCGNVEGELRLHETATGAEVLSVKVDRRKVWSVAWAADGRSVFCGRDTGEIVRRPIESEAIPGGALDELWERLAAEDARKAFGAIRALSARSEGPAYLAARLAEGGGEAEAGKLLEALEDDDPAVRRKAAAALGERMHEVEGPIRKKLEETRSEDVRERLEPLVAALDAPVVSAPLLLRQVRAVWALERAGARKELEALAKPGPLSRAAREAQRALERLDRVFLQSPPERR